MLVKGTYNGPFFYERKILKEQKKFKDIQLNSKSLRFVEEEGFTRPSPVQEQAIPIIRSGESVVAFAQTGSGKTLAYALPIVENLKSNEEDIEEIVGSPRAIILTPTRELSAQVGKVFKKIGHHQKIKVKTLSGGDKGKKMTSLKYDWLDILICSPARLKSALDKKEISTKLLEIVVLDEADQLMDYTFKRDFEGITKKLNIRDCQWCLFSATKPGGVDEWLGSILSGVPFKRVEIDGAFFLQPNLETFNVTVSPQEKPQILEQLINEAPKGKGIVFVNRKENVEKVYNDLKAKDPNKKIWVFHGQMERNARKENIDNFRDQGGVLIASDLFARGMDVKGIIWVLNYDLPHDPIYYIHRCGRAGRHGGSGKIYNFVGSKDGIMVQKINEAINGQSALKLGNLKAPMQKKTKKASTSRKKATAAPKVSKKVAKKKVKRSPRRKRS